MKIDWDRELGDAQLNLAVNQEIAAELAQYDCLLCMDTGYVYFIHDRDPESDPASIKTRCQCQTGGIQYV